MTSPRCAACKYFRRRCPSNCVFAPYFPNGNPQRFIFVHKIDGASNMAKMIEIAQSQLAKAQAEIAILDANFALDTPRPRPGESLLQHNNGDDYGLDDLVNPWFY
nr:LOB domain-containing protein 24-like [Tanacetum cinerariifolium]